MWSINVATRLRMTPLTTSRLAGRAQEAAVSFDKPVRSIQQALVERILRGPGQASPDLRVRAFMNAQVPESLAGLLDKVAHRSADVTDEDFVAAQEAGFTDDQLFELVISAAVGVSSRQYDAGLAALAAAAGGSEAR